MEPVYGSESGTLWRQTDSTGANAGAAVAGRIARPAGLFAIHADAHVTKTSAALSVHRAGPTDQSAIVTVGVDTDAGTAVARATLVDEDAFSALACDAFRVAVASAQTLAYRHDAPAAPADAAARIETAVTGKSIGGRIDLTASAFTERFAGNTWVSVRNTGAVAAIGGTAVLIDGAHLAQFAIAPTAFIAELRFGADIAAIERLPAAIGEFAWAGVLRHVRAGQRHTAVAIGRRAADIAVDANTVATLLRFGAAAEIALGHTTGKGTRIAADIGFFVAPAAGAAADCATTFLVRGILAALRSAIDLAINFGRSIAAEVASALATVASARTAAIDIATSVRYAAAPSLIGRAGKELFAREALTIAADAGVLVVVI
jgi:hypothetical protein